MHLIDWTIIVAYLAWVLYDGVKRAKGTGAIDGYFLASRSLPWWAVGLSVMATQMSAITLVGTTGQGYDDGIRFVQFYFGLPLAMIILSVTLVPFFHRARVFTAYEFLERRFDARTRALTSLLFLVSRGLGAGVIIAAPAVILSIVLGWSLPLTILAIGIPTTLYTMLGGVQAVTWADVKQMVVIMVGVTAAVTALILGLPDDIGLEPVLHVAGATGRLQAIDFTFDLNETYTFWSGLLGGLFLMLGYFGCDQSQVQRYLTAKSVDAGRQSLLMSAFAKIPLQVLILTMGVLVFCFYLFTEPPMLFNTSHEAAVEESGRAGEYRALDDEFRAAHADRRADAAAVVEARGGGGRRAGAVGHRGVRRERPARGRRPGARAESGARRDGRRRLQRRQLRLPDVHHHTPPGRARRAPDRGHLRGGDVEHRGRAQRPVGGQHHRLLPAPLQAGRVRCALPPGVEGGHRLLGPLRRGDRALRRQPGLADRGGQPLRFLLLRLAARGLRPRGRHAALDRGRGVLGPDRRAWRRSPRWRRSPTCRSCGTTWSASPRSA